MPPAEVLDTQELDAEALDARFDAWLERQAQAEPGPEDRPRFDEPQVDLEEDEATGSRRAPWIIGLLIVAILLLVLLGLRQGALFASRSSPARVASASARLEAGVLDEKDADVRERRTPGTDAGAVRGTVLFRSDPSGAQVLLDVGQAPLEISGLAVGVAHELVAIAPGRAPARAVIPADAQWQHARTGPRFELTLSIPPGGDDEAAASLGATRLPDDLGSPSGQRGVVTVRSRPRGARIYRLMGFTPDARIEGLPTDRATHVLLHHPARGTHDVVIGPRRWQRDDGAAVLEIDVADFQG